MKRKGERVEIELTEETEKFLDLYTSAKDKSAFVHALIVGEEMTIGDIYEAQYKIRQKVKQYEEKIKELKDADFAYEVQLSKKLKKGEVLQ